MSALDLLLITQRGKIGDIEIMATLEEVMTDTVKKTENPVAANAPMTDHAYLLPSEVLIRCGWSNSAMDTLLGASTSLFVGGSVGVDYVSNVYSRLLALQQKREPFNLTTSVRQYTSMLITALRVDRDPRTANIILVTATLSQVLIAYTQVTTLPPRQNQADPASTAGVQNSGVKVPVVATPSPGGAVAAENW
jgi:hypothetical protein